MADDMAPQSIQDAYYPDGECFGCGPSNPAGLRIKSFARNDGSVIAQWTPRPEHSNGLHVVCGGILGTVLDCHAAAVSGYALGRSSGRFVSAVTKEYTVRFVGPTPMVPLELVGRAVNVRRRSVAVEVEAVASGVVSVRFEGVFVAPREGES